MQPDIFAVEADLANMQRAARDTFRTCADAADEFADIIAATKLVDVNGPTALRLFAQLLRISGDAS